MDGGRQWVESGERVVGQALLGSVLKAREVLEETGTISPCPAIGT